MSSMKGAWQGHLVETMGIIIELINTLESWVEIWLTITLLNVWNTDQNAKMPNINLLMMKSILANWDVHYDLIKFRAIVSF